MTGRMAQGKPRCNQVGKVEGKMRSDGFCLLDKTARDFVKHAAAGTTAVQHAEGAAGE